MNWSRQPRRDAARLMDEAEAAGARLVLDGDGQPIVRAPRGVLAGSRRAALAEHRAGIRELLALVGPACWHPTSGGDRP